MNMQVSGAKQVLSVFGFWVLSGMAALAFGAVKAPGAPTIGTATAGNASASIAFSAPSSNGGAAITGYTVYCVAGKTTKTGEATSSPVTVSSLTNGKVYSCTVKATNSKGTGAASGAVSVTPISITVPNAPTIGTATAGNASASIAFTVPSSNGGAAIIGYTVSCVAGKSTKTGTATSSPITVPSLTNGKVYSCTVKATNSVGDSAASGAVSVTPAALTTTTVPGAPTIGAATAGNASASIAFTAPSSNGGASITGYTASCVTGSTTKTGTASSSPVTVSNLTNSTAYSCTVKANNSVGSSAASGAVSVTPVAGTTITYSTPSNFADVVAKSYIPSTTLTASSTFSNRGYYMISNAATASTTSNYAAIGSTYSTAGYSVTAGTLVSTSTYNDYLTKTMQLVKATDGYYRIDSYLHPNNSLDVESASSTALRFKNNFGKTSVTDNGFVTFEVAFVGTAVTLTAKNRYTYAIKAGDTTNGSTPYTGSYTKGTFTASGRSLAYASGTYALSSTATSVYLYVTPLSLGVPTFMNPSSVGFVDNGAAPFLSKVTTTAIEGTSGSIYKQVNSTYQSQVAAVGTNEATKAAATTMLATIKSTVEASGGKLRYSTDVYTAYRDAALATKLVSDSIADGTPGQNLVPYVYFTNEKDSSNVYHPMMVVVSYGNQASPNGLKDVPHPPGSAGSDYKDATVTRYSNLENYIFTIPMKDYGQVTDVTTNVYPSSGTKNLWYDMFSKATTSYVGKNVYTWADSADNGILVNGAVMFPAFNNSVVPSHLSGELSASGCHVGQGGGGPHCHADGYQSGQGLGLYNDADYVGKTHPPLLGFGYDGIALFARYRSADTAMLGYGTLDDFGAHNHDSIGYHYHAHTVSSYSSVDQSGATTTKDMYPLMKGAYIGATSSIPFFRTNSSFATNKYLGGTVSGTVAD
ncbi:MAG: fibronectin type III domain-containing protein [Rhodoferax sp.]|nr:fibronectin type III domain-containing protein [Rhodoferax sp.]